LATLVSLGNDVHDTTLLENTQTTNRGTGVVQNINDMFGSSKPLP